jgi:hypothetical protein
MRGPNVAMQPWTFADGWVIARKDDRGPAVEHSPAGEISTASPISVR